MPARAIIGRLTRPKVLLWGGALAVSGAIVINALFLQSARHPSPLFVTRHSPEVAVAKPDQPVRAQADELVRALQDALRGAGYYGGPVDGLAGPQTSSAIVAFERIAGRDVTGQPSAEILDAIRGQAAGKADAGMPEGSKPDGGKPDAPDAPLAAQTADAAAPVADPRVARVQNALSRAAYGQIRGDGVFGPQTSDAIRQFQADHNLPVTGEINDALLVELAAAGALEGE